MPRSERGRIILKGGISGGSAWTGVGRVESGTRFATVTNALVTSGQLIVITPVVVSSPSFIGSGQGFALGVDARSIVTGVSFAVVTGGTVSPTAPIDFYYAILK